MVDVLRKAVMLFVFLISEGCSLPLIMYAVVDVLRKAVMLFVFLLSDGYLFFTLDSVCCNGCRTKICNKVHFCVGGLLFLPLREFFLSNLLPFDEITSLTCFVLIFCFDHHSPLFLKIYFLNFDPKVFLRS